MCTRASGGYFPYAQHGLHLPSSVDAEGRVVIQGVVDLGSVVDDLVAFGPEVADEVGAEFHAGVVGGDVHAREVGGGHGVSVQLGRSVESRGLRGRFWGLFPAY